MPDHMKGKLRWKCTWRTASLLAIGRAESGASKLSACIFALLLMLACGALAQERNGILGRVEDTTGAPIRGAQIEFRTEDGVTVASSNEQGQFRVPANGKSGTLTIRFPGFATATREIRARVSVENLRIVLAPASDLQRVQVTGNASDVIPAVPTSEYDISAEAIDRSGSLPLDEVLAGAGIQHISKVG